MNHQELIQLRNTICDNLIEEGMDYDDARFETMTAAASPTDILIDQQESTHSAIVILAKLASGISFPKVAEQIEPSAEWWNWFDRTDGFPG